MSAPEQIERMKFAKGDIQELKVPDISDETELSDEQYRKLKSSNFLKDVTILSTWTLRFNIVGFDSDDRRHLILAGLSATQAKKALEFLKEQDTG